MSPVLTPKRIAGDATPERLAQHEPSPTIRDLLHQLGQRLAEGRQGEPEERPVASPPPAPAPADTLTALEHLLAAPTAPPEIPAEIREQIATLTAQADTVKAAWEAVAAEHGPYLDRVEASVRHPRFPQTAWSAGVDPNRVTTLLERLGACLRRAHTAMTQGQAVERLLDPSLSAADRAKAMVAPVWTIRNLSDAGTSDFFHLLGELRAVLAAIVTHAGSRELIPAPELPAPPRAAAQTAFDVFSGRPQGGVQ
jgi:hypothetical protein